MREAPTGQRTLPSNPNCVVYAADARDVLGARSFRDVQRIAARALERFHGESGLEAAAAFAWRSSQDRRNKRVHQVLLAYVFDGPATAAHLGLLDDEASVSPVSWSAGSIERLPANAIPSLLAANGQLHQLWVVRDGRAVLQRLLLGDRGVSLQEVPASDVHEEDVLEGVTHAIARPPTLDELDGDIERMRLVFAQHVTRAIVNADGISTPEEEAFVRRVFPPELMVQLGVTDDAARDAWLDAARRRLPTALGHHDKLAMIGLFFSACYSDGQLDAREVRVLREAAEALGLTRQEVVTYLQRLW